MGHTTAELLTFKDRFKEKHWSEQTDSNSSYSWSTESSMISIYLSISWFTLSLHQLRMNPCLDLFTTPWAWMRLNNPVRLKGELHHFYTSVWYLINCIKRCHLSQYWLVLKTTSFKMTKKSWVCGVRKTWGYQTTVACFSSLLGLAATLAAASITNPNLWLNIPTNVMCLLYIYLTWYLWFICIYFYPFFKQSIVS